LFTFFCLHHFYAPTQSVEACRFAHVLISRPNWCVDVQEANIVFLGSVFTRLWPLTDFLLYIHIVEDLVCVPSHETRHVYEVNSTRCTFVLVS